MLDKLSIILPYLTNLISIPLTSYFTYLAMNKNDKFNHRRNKRDRQLEDLQAKNDALQIEINALNSNIERFTAVKQAENGNCLILIQTNEYICPTCWGNDQKAIPIYDNGTGYYECSICNTRNIYDIDSKNKNDKSFTEMTKSMRKPNPYAGLNKNWRGN